MLADDTPAVDAVLKADKYELKIALRFSFVPFYSSHSSSQSSLGVAAGGKAATVRIGEESRLSLINYWAIVF